jgi:hypothetical protein
MLDARLPLRRRDVALREQKPVENDHTFLMEQGLQRVGSLASKALYILCREFVQPLAGCGASYQNRSFVENM